MSPLKVTLGKISQPPVLSCALMVGLPEGASADARRNRCISDVAEPGSTFKIVVCSGALNEGVVSLNDQFDCEKGGDHGHSSFASSSETTSAVSGM